MKNEMVCFVLLLLYAKGFFPLSTKNIFLSFSWSLIPPVHQDMKIHIYGYLISLTLAVSQHFPMFQREFSVSNTETFFFLWLLQWLFSPWLSSSDVNISSGNNGGGRTWEGRRGGREGVFEILLLFVLRKILSAREISQTRSQS